jgi:hypothetical protein
MKCRNYESNKITEDYMLFCSNGTLLPVCSPSAIVAV